MKQSILLLETDPQIIDQIIRNTRDHYDICVVHTLHEGVEAFSKQTFSIILASESLINSDYVSFFDRCSQTSISSDIIVLIEENNFQSSIDVMLKGASGLLVKPFFDDELRTTLRMTTLNKKHISVFKESLKKRLPKGMWDIVESMDEQSLKHPFEASHEPTFTSIFKQYMSKKKPTLLIVEDDPNLQDTYQVLLSKKYSVLFAKTGRDAIQLLDKHPLIEVALVDIGLPDMSGEDLVVSLKEKSPLLEVVVVSAFRDLDVVMYTIQNGASDFIPKPFIPSQLYLKIEKYLYRHRLKTSLLRYAESL